MHVDIKRRCTTTHDDILRAKALITKADNERLIGTIALVVSNRSIIAARDAAISTPPGTNIRIGSWKNFRSQLFSTGENRSYAGRESHRRIVLK